MGIQYRDDKNIPLERLLELYRASQYNHWWKERNARAIVGHCFAIITAWEEDQCVGTVTVITDGVNYAHIDDLVVHPSFRSQGIGTHLMQMALEKLEPLHLDFVQLFPIPGRETFFQRLGFKVIQDSQVMELPKRTD